MASVRTRVHYRQILLFLIAVILPSSVLIALTWRMVGQQRELREKRSTEERQQLAREIGQRLLVRLEEIKLHEVSVVAAGIDALNRPEYASPEVVLIGLMDGDRLVLPWEAGRADHRLNRFAGDSALMEKVRDAERKEFAERRLVEADALYREGIEEALQLAERAYVRLSRARTLVQGGAMEESIAEYRKLMSLDMVVTDEHGIPFCVYAAGCLAEANGYQQQVLQRIESMMNTSRWLPPAAHCALRDLLTAVADSGPDVPDWQGTVAHLQRAIQQRIDRQETALRVQRDFPTLMLMTRWNRPEEGTESIWVPYGEEPLLIGLASAGPQRLVVLVRGRKLLDAVMARVSGLEAPLADVRFATRTDPGGEPLGPSFPGLEVISAGGMLSPASDGGLPQSFYLAALLLVLCVTGFGAYSVWKDVGRELRMAQMRSHFVASVSHELRTPLTAIRTSAETLRLGRCRNPRTRAEYLDAIVNESHRLTRLLNNVLDFSRIERDRRVYRKEPADLAAIVRAAVQAMQYPLRQQDFHLETSIEEDLPPLRVDRDAIEQALLNLLSNAMKYSGESKRIALRVHRSDDHAVIEVVDHGIGIPEGEQQRIFEKFYRVPDRENAGIPGAGLGLALVAHIVQAHGGRIALQSAPGRGSTLAIHLPLESTP